MILLPLLCAILPQNGQEPSVGPAAQPLNRVEMIVNTDVVTRRQLVRQLERARAGKPVTTREELLALRVDIFQGTMEALLLRQAGEDLGQPKEAVERVLENVWQNQIERSGGAQEFSLQVEAEELSSLEKRQKLESDIYAWTYTRVITGNEPGTGGRLVADRYIRPGTRRRLYDYMGSTGDGLRQIGGQPMTIVVQELRLMLDPGGEPAERRARALSRRQQAESLRRRALAGEDFNALVNEHGIVKGADSLSGSLPVDVLRQQNPGMADFALKAAVGDISPVLPVREPERGTVEGWRVVRILETDPGSQPPFDDLEVQRRLELLAQRQLDTRRRDEAVKTLLESAYVWNPDLERARAERAARAAETAAEAAARP